MFTCLDNDGKARRDEDGDTETVAKDDLIKVDKSPDQDRDKNLFSVSESPCRQSVSVKSHASDGKCRQPPAAGNDRHYRIEAAAGRCDGKDGMCRDIDRRGAGNASFDNIRRLERPPYVKCRDASTPSSDKVRMLTGDGDREQERKIQQELKSWIRKLSDYGYKSSHKKGMRLRSSVPLRIGSKPLDLHTMAELGLKYSGDQDVKGKPHGQGAMSLIKLHCPFI